MPIVHRVAGRLGAGQMAHQQRKAVIFQLDARGHRHRFIRAQPEPVHAGIHMQRRAAAPIGGGHEGVPLGELGRAVDDRAQIGILEGSRGMGRQPVEHIDDGIARERPHAAALGDVGHEEGLAAGLGEPGGDRLEAAPIGVGLDHGCALDRHGAAGKHAPIGFDGGEVDGQETAGGCRIVTGRRRLVGGRCFAGLEGGFLNRHRGVMAGCLAGVQHAGVVPTYGLGLGVREPDQRNE